ncbi:MAG: DUF1858 domain-containing protein [Deltaproteobacteria bacterium]|nr:DUF1858 domain-containing protein [Deltaproteobacteria bacterium]
MKSRKIINKDILIDELIRKYPEVCKVLEKYGMNCKECALAPTSTLENAAEIHNISLKVLLNEINKCINEKLNE